MSKADVIEFGLYVLTIAAIYFCLFVIKDWRKPFNDKELRPAGPPSVVVNPYAATTYDKKIF